MKREFSVVGKAALFLPVCAITSAMTLAMLLAPSAVRADELKLKDGSTISGTIVGYEENSFKVKTSYGYAVVQKDQVVSIGISVAAPRKRTPSRLPKKPRPLKSRKQNP